MKQLVSAIAVASLVVLPANADILEQILVKVNGDIFTKTDLEARQVAYLRSRNQQFDQEQLKTDEGMKKVLQDITPTIVVEAVDELLVFQRGRALGYRLGDEQFKSIIGNIKKDNKIETEEQFAAALKAENITMDDLRRSLERQMMMTRVQQQEVMGKVSVTEPEERAYYQAHPDEFTSKSEISVREILVASDATGTTEGGDGASPQGLNVAEDEAAMAKAGQARARVMAGEDFAKVAGELSDAPSKANGGLIGPISRDELAPALQTAIEPLKVGDVSAVIRTARGYQILKLESATEATVEPFEGVRERIADKVYAQKRQVEMKKYIERLRAQAIIEWKNDDLKKAYDTGLQAIADRQSAAPTS